MTSKQKLIGKRLRISGKTYQNVLDLIKDRNYSQWPIEEIIESLINIGIYTTRDGFDGSVYLKRNGDFGIHY